MYIRYPYRAGEPPVLEEADDFTSFKIVIPIDRRKNCDHVKSGLGWTVDDDRSMFVRIDAIKDLAGHRSSDTQWLENLDAMISFAAGKGWLDPSSNAIQGHIELG